MEGFQGYKSTKNHDVVILKENLSLNAVQYSKGDIFTIIGEDSLRGWNLRHNKTGNKIYECRFIRDLFEYSDIKKERKVKLNKINGNTII